MIVGVDEVGRGSLAGPLCIAAVALGDNTLPGLTDSKKLTAKKRELFNAEIKRVAPLVGIGWVSARDIDRIGMGPALKLAATRAIEQLDLTSVTQIIIDGTIRLYDDPRVTTMKQADLLVPSVSAASVIAKVARDCYMTTMHELFPDYGFAGHVGYGTAKHMAAIENSGPTPLHRMTFAPLNSLHPAPTAVRVTDGSRAEDAATTFMAQQGYVVIDRNWKTKWCEIDIIASKDGRIHFVEVKYRRNDRHGDGLAAITPKKQRQMKFAAELWLANHPPADAALAVMSVSGDTFTIDEFIQLV